MINSTLCPLCPSGIGHPMDDEHAARVRELLAALDAEHLQVVTLRDGVDLPMHEMSNCPICKIIAKAEAL